MGEYSAVGMRLSWREIPPLAEKPAPVEMTPTNIEAD
jgi:hypothetical protein